MFEVRKPLNEPAMSYAPGSCERKLVKEAIGEIRQFQKEIPLIIGGKEVRTGNTGSCVIPHDHGHVLGKYHIAGPREVQMAVDAALAAKRMWEDLPWEHRVAIFLRAAELLAGSWRPRIIASTMLAQSKTVYQAEIDAACELIDFLRFNCYFAAEIYNEQPESIQDSWNRIDWRPLEGFVFAVTPFNFLAIAGNLGAAPALVGNTVVWKPSSASVFSNYQLMKVFQEAGLPDGVINFVPGPGNVVGTGVLENQWLAGIHFTGSTATFRSMWRTVGTNIDRYRTYPRLVGETGGKDFVVVHPSANYEAAVTALLRGAFEYQGQKCSAASRAYIPQSLWPRIKDGLISAMDEVKTGDVEDFRTFVGALIDKAAYDRVKAYVDLAKSSPEAKVFGGACDDSKGYFVEPTLIVTSDPRFRTMEEEIFGPVLSVYVYKDEDYTEILGLCDSTSPYGLTGSILATEREAIVSAEKHLRHAAGNFYINDKPTGAVVGQQPFGGSRASGTNDKAGSGLNLRRWVSPRVIKESLCPPKQYGYPSMLEQ